LTHSCESGEVVVLWVSRHPPLPAQLRELEKKLGPIKLERLSSPIPSAEYVIGKAEELCARVIIPVLPMSFIARIVEYARQHGFVVLYAKMQLVFEAEKSNGEAVKYAWKLVHEDPERRTAVGYADCIRVFEFQCFEKVIDVKVVTEPW
jgi:hypothetical protein